MKKDDSIGEKLKYYRKRLNLTLRALEEKSGIAYNSISGYENNKVIPQSKTLERLAQALNITVNDLMPSESQEEPQEFIKEHPGFKDYFEFYSNTFVHIPVLGKVHAGDPNEIPEDIVIGGIDLPISMAKGSDYALKVTGMSMKEKGIDEGDIVLIRLQKYAEDGQVVIARVNSERYVIKEFKSKNGRTWLESANSLYEPITENFEIIGIIKKLVKDFI